MSINRLGGSVKAWVGVREDEGVVLDEWCFSLILFLSLTFYVDIERKAIVDFNDDTHDKVLSVCCQYKGEILLVPLSVRRVLCQTKLTLL